MLKLICYIISFIIIFTEFSYSYTIDKIKAVAGDEVITKTEIDEIMVNFLDQGISLSNEKYRNKIIFNLIEQKLVDNIISRFNIKLSEQDLRMAVNSKIRQDMSSFPSPEQFVDYLKQEEGISVEEYRNKLMEQIQNSEDFKNKLLYDKFIQSQVSGKVIITEKELFRKYDFSIILVEKPEVAFDILIKLRQNEDFEDLKQKYSTYKNKDELKEIGDSLFSVEQNLIKLYPGDVSGVITVTDDSQQKVYGYAIIKLNETESFDRKDKLEKLAEDLFEYDYNDLSQEQKIKVDNEYENYIETKKQRLFAIKVMNVKDNILKQIWDSGYIRILN